MNDLPFFERTPGLKKALARLGKSVDEVDRLAALQETAIMVQRAATAIVRRHRRGIREMLKAIVRVRALVALEHPTVGLIGMPPVKSDTDLQSSATAILKIVAPNAQLFVEEGLPEHVLTDLPLKISALARARARQNSARADYTVATMSVLRALKEGDAAVKVLESVLVTSPDASPRILTMMRVAKRVGHRPKPHTEADATPSETKAP